MENCLALAPKLNKLIYRDYTAVRLLRHWHRELRHKDVTEQELLLMKRSDLYNLLLKAEDRWWGTATDKFEFRRVLKDLMEIVNG